MTELSRRALLIRSAQMMTAAAAAQSGLLAAQAPSHHQMPGMTPTQGPSQPIVGNGTTEHRPWLHPEHLARFVDPLPIPAALSAGEMRPHPTEAGKQVRYHRVALRRVPVRAHRDLQPTFFWSYVDTAAGASSLGAATSLGPTIEARSNEPLLIEWANELPTEHFLPIDHNLCGAGKDQPQVRTAVHVHGARVSPENDGYPDDWQVPGKSRTAFYPLEQEAATLWYHDHAMGIERLNQYAGLYGFFLIRDAEEEKLNLPSGKYEIPLAIADRFFYADGQLHYPDSGDPSAPWVPEIYGDVILANGAIFPYLEVEPRLYRIRLLNASNSRLYLFSLSNGHGFHQIGSDQGLLAAPVAMKELMLSPAERADILIDFSSLAGTEFTLQDSKLTILQFRVSKADASSAGSGSQAAAAKRQGVPTLLRTIDRIPASAAVKTRTFTLNEYMDPKTRIMLMLLNGKRWHEPVTEKPVLNSTEIWSFINTTEDMHPIHLHMVRFQILDRRGYDVDAFLNQNQFHYLGEAAPPEANELGWKDTVKAHPETVTRIIVPFQGFTGRYVWHCHLLEHAANEMMRPFEIVPA